MVLHRRPNLVLQLVRLGQSWEFDFFSDGDSATGHAANMIGVWSSGFVIFRVGESATSLAITCQLFAAVYMHICFLVVCPARHEESFAVACRPAKGRLGKLNLPLPSQIPETARFQPGSRKGVCQWPTLLWWDCRQYNPRPTGEERIARYDELGNGRELLWSSTLLAVCGNDRWKNKASSIAFGRVEETLNSLGGMCLLNRLLVE